jgi:hypothetical protein
MKAVLRPWHDPVFFGFLGVGLCLLFASALCFVCARQPALPLTASAPADETASMGAELPKPEDFVLSAAPGRPARTVVQWSF